MTPTPSLSYAIKKFGHSNREKVSFLPCSFATRVTRAIMVVGLTGWPRNYNVTKTSVGGPDNPYWETGFSKCRHRSPVVLVIHNNVHQPSAWVSDDYAAEKLAQDRISIELLTNSLPHATSRSILLTNNTGFSHCWVWSLSRGSICNPWLPSLVQALVANVSRICNRKRKCDLQAIISVWLLSLAGSGYVLIMSFSSHQDL